MSREEWNRKREHILVAALRLFAEKGYHSATMQDISKEAGIAKGSIYSYFDSKEQLLLSIYEHYTAKLEKRLQRLEHDSQLTPLMKMQKHIHDTFQQITNFKHFFTMHVRESAAPLNEEMKQILLRANHTEIAWLRSRIREIYGRSVEPYTLDLAVTLQALTREYIVFLLFDRTHFEIDRVTTFLMNRLDDMAKGMINRAEAPLMTEGVLNELVRKFLKSSPLAELEAEEWIRALRERMGKMSKHHFDVKEAASVLDLLEKEWAKDKPRPVMLKSLLSYFRALNPALEWPEISKLEQLADQISD